jgi:hypothetical protein
MKLSMDKFYSFFNRFKKLVKLIDRETKMNLVIRSVLGALLFSLLSLLIPALIIINMFINTKLTFLLAILSVILVMSFSFIYYYFYYRLLKNYHPKLENINTTIPQYVESSIISFIFLVIGIIVLSFIF